MLHALIVLAALIVAYALACTWLVFWRGPFKTAYNGLVAQLLGVLAPNMECITLGSHCYLFSDTDTITPQRIVHERFHYEQQWRRYGPLFPLLYVIQVIRSGIRNVPFRFSLHYVIEVFRYGYRNAPFEVAARAAAAEQ